MRAMRSVFSSPMRVQLSPPSVVLYTPSPTPTLLRVHDSPVPTHTVFGSFGLTRMAPMDGVSRSNTGFQVVPASRDTHTPPPALPTHSTSRSPLTPSMQEMRPLITPGPSERALSPSNVSESSFQSSAAVAAVAANSRAAASAP